MQQDVRPTAGDSSWYTRDKFGLFIHWGLYSLGARHEWLMHREAIEPDEYRRRYFPRFDPDLYDPERWADLAAEAGMKYFVITTKHHEGFCLWDSQYTDYKATNSPAKRDLLRPMVEAFRKRGIRVGLYYSLIDWSHPHFVIDDQHAMRAHPKRDEWNAGRDQGKYIEYMHNQVRELLTGFGQIDLLFFDFSYPSRWGWKNWKGEAFCGKEAKDWGAEELVKLCRKLQPGILLNDRLDLMDQPDGWDIKTPEQYIPRDHVKVHGQKVVWEACHTFSGSWGYHRDESSWKSEEQLVQMLVECVARGGNLLLNVGPTSRGEFDDRAVDRLRGMGRWMKRHGRSIFGCTEAPAQFQRPRNAELTYNPQLNRLYVHMLNWPYGALHLPGYGDRVEYAQLLNDGSELKIKQHKTDNAIHVGLDEGLQEGDVSLALPVQKPDATVPVVELFLK